MPTTERVEARGQFAKTVKDKTVKIQIGVRGTKISPDWVAVDLCDKSDLIDHNWDIQNLPLEDESVDCYVCNAILEHVPAPDLAIYEMYRTLKVGGHVWVEVPFLQMYHAHPYDFFRWTLYGIRRSMRDFEEIRSGITELASYEVARQFDYLHKVAKKPLNPSIRESVFRFVKDLESKIDVHRLYSGCFFWGKKAPLRIPDEKRKYMEYLKQELAREKP